MKADVLIHSASQILTLTGDPQRGSDLGKLGLIEDGAVAIGDEKILAVGSSAELRSAYQAEMEIDATNRVVLPGLVDPHTHLIWAGDRAAEFEMRVAGATYTEIMDAGGGIISTVHQTRAASVDALITQVQPRLRRMLAHGTTTAEVKTGYGLDTQTELRMLETILHLDKQGPMELAPTFLGAHAIPIEYSDRPDEYTNLVCDEMLPAVKEWWQQNAAGCRLPFVDVFCETGAFNLDQSRRILERARTIGFPLKIHADEFNSLGGTGLAVELGATSADHLVYTTAEDILALGASDTVAVSLPCTPFGLAEEAYTPAKDFLQAGGILALATDLNPGTAWCESMQFAIALACRYMHLTPAQAIVAATINAAAAIGRADRVGSIQPGKQADLIILEAPDYRHLGYRFGTNLVTRTIKKGKIVYTQEEEEVL